MTSTTQSIETLLRRRDRILETMYSSMYFNEETTADPELIEEVEEIDLDPRVAKAIREKKTRQLAEIVDMISL